MDNPVYNAQKMANLLQKVPQNNENSIEIDLLQNILSKLDTLNIIMNNTIIFDGGDEDDDGTRIYLPCRS